MDQAHDYIYEDTYSLKYLGSSMLCSTVMEFSFSSIKVQKIRKKKMEKNIKIYMTLVTQKYTLWILCNYLLTKMRNLIEYHTTLGWLKKQKFKEIKQTVLADTFIIPCSNLIFFLTKFVVSMKHWWNHRHYIHPSFLRKTQRKYIVFYEQKHCLLARRV